MDFQVFELQDFLNFQWKIESEDGILNDCLFCQLSNQVLQATHVPAY
uniref:Uncharacterized protein n=1 Tax=Lotus japonicus TaxID=34305 RepID=I3SBY1_LOTJA|nr:unknown [Lotus japonicus]